MTVRARSPIGWRCAIGCGALRPCASVDLLSFDRSQLRIGIRYIGDLNQLRAALHDRNLDLAGSDPDWTLALQAAPPRWRRRPHEKPVKPVNAEPTEIPPPSSSPIATAGANRMPARSIRSGTAAQRRSTAVSLPNLITLSRLLSVPIIIWLVLTSALTAALIMFALAGLSDAVDGFIARRFNQRSALGAMLDPARRQGDAGQPVRHARHRAPSRRPGL